MIGKLLDNYFSFKKKLTNKENDYYLKFSKKIKIKNLAFGYKNEKKLLGPINLDIQKGDIIGITGKNGSGKSTLIELICGFLKPQKGNIFFRWTTFKT